MRRDSMHGFKLIRQHDAMECGIASLAMICAHYGKNISVSYLSSLCRPTNEGVSMQGMKETCASIGLESQCGYLTIKSLRKINKPLILHWHQNHFVVLYKISKDGRLFFIADPAKGKIKYNIDQFKSYWICSVQKEDELGIAMLLEPTDLFFKINEDIKKRHSFHFLLTRIRDKFYHHQLRSRHDKSGELMQFTVLCAEIQCLRGQSQRTS